MEQNQGAGIPAPYFLSCIERLSDRYFNFATGSVVFLLDEILMVYRAKQSRRRPPVLYTHAICISILEVHTNLLQCLLLPAYNFPDYFYKNNKSLPFYFSHWPDGKYSCRYAHPA